MADTRDTKWSIKHGGGGNAKHVLRELILAWANDSVTKQLKYILELRASERGSKCNCECPSCGAQLIAVNVGKEQFVHRPHFRHPSGSARDTCEVLTARVAALRMLLELGEIELPARRLTGHIIGLSGKSYSAGVARVLQKVKITSGAFQDATSALLTLDDGRTLIVKIVGSIQVIQNSAPTSFTSNRSGFDVRPTIEIELPDNSFASLSPENLRSRLKLLVGGGNWVCHWDDAELSKQADEAAKVKARDAIDFPSDDDPWMLSLPKELQHETLLHLEVKRILERTKRIHLPELRVYIEKIRANSEVVFVERTNTNEWIEIVNVELEKRIGQTIPDVVLTLDAKTVHGEIILIEVTVTNPIDEERLSRIQSVNLPTLEISFKQTGGSVSKAELEKLVVAELVLKKWLHHPWITLQREEAELLLAVSENAAKPKYMIDESLALSKELSDWAQDFLKLFQEEAALQANNGQANFLEEKERVIASLTVASEAIAYYGFPEVRDHSNSETLGKILGRLLTIKLDVGVGYRYKENAAVQVMNAIRNDHDIYKKWTYLFLIAAHAYGVKQKLTASSSVWFETLREKVAGSIISLEEKYLRDTRYDMLLALLFPELEMLLLDDFGKKFHTQEKVKNTISLERKVLPTTAASKLKSKKVLSKSGELVDTQFSSEYLQGSDLERWFIDKSPEEVKYWRRKLNAK